MTFSYLNLSVRTGAVSGQFNGRDQDFVFYRHVRAAPDGAPGTHDIDEALYLSDRIVLMDGRPGPALTQRAGRPGLESGILDSLYAVHAL